ncbi:hypothetical protein ACLB1R_19545 [Escherichia coli]
MLSNDDGRRPAIETLAKALREFADVQVVAPIVTAAALQLDTANPPCARLPLKTAIFAVNG